MSKRVNMARTLAFRRPVVSPFVQMRSFNVSMAGLAGQMAGTGIGSKKINVETLCEIIGTKYYKHNEEINLDQEITVRCFDENDQNLGEMSLHQALQAAQQAKKDLVLRNQKVQPPIVKIMNYKRELLKRLFKKLGKEIDDKNLKSKTLSLATTISYHDLENKKRQAMGFLKNHQILKFYMKVNIYDPENIQKGRNMLLNIAEDMKEYCKVIKSPEPEKKEEAESTPGEQKPGVDDFERVAKRSKENRENFVSLEASEVDDYDNDFENQPQYLYMELKSTSSFKDIDIDRMLEHTTFDEFMRGLYINRVEQKKHEPAQADQPNDFDQMMKQMVDFNEEGQQEVQLDFSKGKGHSGDFLDE